MRALPPVRTAAPATLPVSVDELRTHLREDSSEQDVVLLAAIQAATAALDGWAGILGRALISQAWRQDFDGFPAEPRLRLDLGDLISVTTVAYTDTAGVEKELSASLYSVHADAIGPYLRLRKGETWPATDEQDDAVRVTAVYGYGTDATSVPAPIRSAILLMAGDLFRAREASSGTPLVEHQMPLAAGKMIESYRRRMT